MIIRLAAIEIFAHHGVQQEEIEYGNHFEIDVEIEIPDTRGLETDALAETLDYTKIAASVSSVSAQRRYNLLEAFAHDISMELEKNFPRFLSMSIKVRKLNPPMEESVKFVEVELRIEK